MKKQSSSLTARLDSECSARMVGRQRLKNVVLAVAAMIGIAMVCGIGGLVAAPETDLVEDVTLTAAMLPFAFATLRAPEDGEGGSNGGGGKKAESDGDDDGDAGDGDGDAGDGDGDDGDGDAGDGDGDGDDGDGDDGEQASGDNVFQKALAFLGVGREDKPAASSLEAVTAENVDLKAKVATLEAQVAEGKQLAAEVMKLKGEQTTVGKAAAKVAKSMHVAKDDLPKGETGSGGKAEAGLKGRDRLASIFVDAHGGGKN